jgi:predicted ATPase
MVQFGYVGIFPAGQPIRLGGRAFDLLSIAREQEAKLWELRGAASLARLWRDQGHLAAARDLLASVYGWFTEGFATVDLKEAKGVLNKLT